ncbi:hypothetical protein [Alienimonas californiensis]|uniref:Uncharacterized protein n=1 Tax=Alienimonas californiensis TaxID=2527989 RepID=A0A517PD95_9PLAN|nr:hypothetical protein [Alienimonas californiensis]QDT17346.1 hypothetical protein CA12_34670 [Alienimonas californiensis]
MIVDPARTPSPRNAPGPRNAPDSPGLWYGFISDHPDAKPWCLALFDFNPDGCLVDSMGEQLEEACSYRPVVRWHGPHPVPPFDGMGGETIRVKIAVAVDMNGEWSAHGGTRLLNGAAAAIAATEVGGPSTVCFVEADAPLPTAPAGVVGAVTAAGNSGGNSAHGALTYTLPSPR